MRSIGPRPQDLELVISGIRVCQPVKQGEGRCLVQYVFEISGAPSHNNNNNTKKKKKKKKKSTSKRRMPGEYTYLTVYSAGSLYKGEASINLLSNNMNLA